jgi:hypothetical protein
MTKPLDDARSELLARRIIRGLLYYADGHGLSDKYARELSELKSEAHKFLTAPVPQCEAEPDPLADLVARFSRRLLAKLRLAQANGKSGWERDDWETACQQGLLRHLEKGDPRDVAAYCAFMDHHGWITKPAAAPARCDAGSAAPIRAMQILKEISELSEDLQFYIGQALVPPPSEARREAEMYRIRDLIASHIACEKDCQTFPTGCGCALTAARALSDPGTVAVASTDGNTP